MNCNLRRNLLSLAILFGIAAPWAAIANATISNVGSGPLDDRVTQLERIINAQSELLTQVQQQVSDQQRQVDDLRGQLQESQYQLQQMQKLQPTANTGQSTQVENMTGSLSGDQTENMASAGDGDIDYNQAVSLALEQKQYDAAIVAFESFLKKYPDSSYLSNANYWLGQLNYNKGQKEQAAQYFAYVVKHYPQSPKSPDSMLKVGIIMQEKGEKLKAKAVYQQLLKVYAKSDAAKQAQKRLSEI